MLCYTPPKRFYMGKLIIISAPSGTGKSTLIGRLMRQVPELRLRFSISATSRSPRGAEQHGVEYYFFSPEEFRERIARGEFLEWEEVYAGKYYGTLWREVERIFGEGSHVIFDVDYVGGLNIKRAYGEDALAIFIAPPSIEALRQRLEMRSTDSPEVIEERLAKAERELEYASEFDLCLVNDDLDICYRELEASIRLFLNQKD